MAATIAELYGVEAIAGYAAVADPAARLAAQRAGLAALEQESPAGRDETISGVPCRVFNAVGASGTYLHFHGGAMIMGSSRIHDVANAELAEELGVRVVSVDYRLAPEHPFPAALDDCMAVARGELDRSDGPIVLGGESAGGYYAALRRCGSAMSSVPSTASPESTSSSASTTSAARHRTSRAGRATCPTSSTAGGWPTSSRCTSRAGRCSRPGARPTPPCTRT
jgi:hypothetical protein